MTIINNIAEFERLLLTWQPKSGGTRYVVGQIETNPHSGYVFEYLPELPDFSAAKDKGFVGFPAFDINTKVHEHNVLDIFAKRLPPKSRGDFKAYLSSHRLPESFIETNSMFSLLAYTGAKSPADGFCLVPDLFSAKSKTFDFLLEVAGTRYLDGLDLEPVMIGDAVRLKPEPTNEHDPNAIAIVHSSEKIGYVNRVLCPFINSKLSNGLITARIAKKNGTLDRPLVYLVVSVMQ